MFQILDDKKSCPLVYEGGVILNSLPQDADKTWSYADSLRSKKVEYAQIYSGGKSLKECCPENLKNSLNNVSKKMLAFLNSLNEAKVSLEDNCFYDLVPARFLKEYCDIKDKICEHVFSTYTRPTQYDFLLEFTEFLFQISKRDLNIDKKELTSKIYIPQTKKLIEKINSNFLKLNFNMFSSVTGRLTLNDNSFPILNLPVKLRSIIKPKNDWFISFDLNAAEMRIALALAGKTQPEIDLYEDLRTKIFKTDKTRSYVKSTTTQWLYEANNADTIKYNNELDLYFDKQFLIKNYLKNGIITTPYDREITSDLHHAVSYLCQSTLIDMFHRQILKINKLLLNKDSFIAFPLHDQVILDLKETEKNLIPSLITNLSDTPYGKFPVKVEIGKNFGDMKKINFKA